MQCKSEDEGMEWLKEVISDCAAKEHASSIDIDEVLAYKEASTYNGKCFRACIGETTGIVSTHIFYTEFESALKLYISFAHYPKFIK